MIPATASPEEALRRFSDVTAFRPGQEDAINALVADHDTLVVMPTGAGKSLIYQVAALVLPGTALVVSPLLALIHDQMSDLEERNYAGVAALHSHIPEAQQRATLEALAAGRLRLLYVTPERCTEESFLAAARGAQISLMAIDEAHCISEWGHDFRPAYLLLGEAARSLGRPPIAALTATATPWVREEIIDRLGLRDPRVIVHGFDRPNLFYEVYPVSDERDKRRVLARILTDTHSSYQTDLDGALAGCSAGSGIVYTALTRSARSLSQWLNQQGVLAAYYHGQLRGGARTAVQERFRDGGLRAIAATNAFGLGIDLPDLRFVIHYDAPPSLESYYQESGRAGRDGELARCPLLYRPEDLGRAAFAGGSSALDEGRLQRIALALRSAPAAGAGRAALAQETRLPAPLVVRALELLASTGAVAERRGHYRARDLEQEHIRQAVELDQRRQEHDRTRIEMVRSYVQGDGCRRQFLLQYLGQYDAPARCGMCDRCVPRRSTVALDRIAVRAEVPPTPIHGFSAGAEVEHDTWGHGVVQHVAEATLTALFDGAGYRTLDLRTVIAGDLLRVAGSPA